MIRDLSRKLRVQSVFSQYPITGIGGSVSPYIDTHILRITVDEIVLEDDNGNVCKVMNVDVQTDIKLIGAGGLDRDAVTIGKWYHAWLISDSTMSVKGLLSLSSSTPTMPSGYVYKAYIGAVYYKLSDPGMNVGCFTEYYQNDKLVWAKKTYPLPMTSFPTIPSKVDLSASVPSTASSVLLEISGMTQNGGSFISNIMVGPTLNGPWYNQYLMVAGTLQGAGTVDHIQFKTQCEVILHSEQIIFAKAQTPQDLMEINVLGWRY